MVKPWSRKAVERFGWIGLGSGITAMTEPRVYWYQATPGDGLAHWECPCGLGGHGFSITLCRFRLWVHLRHCTGEFIRVVP